MKSIARISLFLTLLVLQVLSAPLQNDGKVIFRDENDVDPCQNTDILECGTVDSTDSSGHFDRNLESGSLFQGDIHLLQDQRDALLTDTTDDGILLRTGILLESMRWPKNDGFVSVPYVIDSSYTKAHQALIERGMQGIERFTCIRFVERTHEEDYIKIKTGSGCSSYLGKVGQEQDVILSSKGCMVRGIIQHELIHALGYDHMHSHADRDRYVDIKWENISPATRDNFDKVNPKYFGNFGTTYDLYSVMHYHANAFSKNGEDTIVPRNSRYKRIMGQRVGISKGDAERVNNMYKCDMTKRY